MMDRIAILGRCGSGKSTLARRVGQTLDVPATHLDALWWRPGWVESDLASFRAAVAKVSAQQRWVIDGNYSRTFDLRLRRADTVVFLDPPRWLCLWRVLWRTASGFGRTRPDVAEGCPERFDPKFFLYVWRWDRDVRPRLWAAVAALIDPETVLVLKTRRDIAAFLQRLERKP